MLHHFAQNENLNGITGVVLTRNFRQNLVTRMADLNIALSCMISRPIRSVFGALETTSGALSMYKKEILFDNLTDYLTSGTYSDDRQLCFYSVLTGDAIAKTDLIVHSDMPTTLKTTVKQRLRWAKGSWRFFPKQMKHLSWQKKIFPIVSMIQTLSVYPIYLFLLYLTLDGQLSPLVLYLLIRSIIKLLYTYLYVRAEERMSLSEKILTLVIIAPLELLFSLLVLPYLKLKALFYLEDEDWATRPSV